jgi:hypothetical protein
VAQAHRDADGEIKRRENDLYALEMADTKPDAIRQAETALKNAKV